MLYTQYACVCTNIFLTNTTSNIPVFHKRQTFRTKSDSPEWCPIRNSNLCYVSTMKHCPYENLHNPAISLQVCPNIDHLFMEWRCHRCWKGNFACFMALKLLFFFFPSKWIFFKKKEKRKARCLHLIFFFCAKATQYEMVSCSEMSIKPFINSYWNKISLEQYRKLYARSNNMTNKRSGKEK